MNHLISRCRHPTFLENITCKLHSWPGSLLRLHGTGIDQVGTSSRCTERAAHASHVQLLTDHKAPNCFLRQPRKQRSHILALPCLCLLAPHEKNKISTSDSAGKSSITAFSADGRPTQPKPGA